MQNHQMCKNYKIFFKTKLDFMFVSQNRKFDRVLNTHISSFN